MPCRCWQGFTGHQGKAQPNMAKLIGTTTLRDMHEGSYYTEARAAHGYTGRDAEAAFDLLMEEGLVVDLHVNHDVTIVFGPAAEAQVTDLVAAL
jgi:hypothetical protein